MKSYFLTGFFMCLLVLGPAVLAQTTEHIDWEQQELRNQQLLLQKKKDSLYKLNAELQRKLVEEQKQKTKLAKLKYRNSIGFDPAYSLFYYGVSFTYERALAKKHSLRLSLGFYDYAGTDEYRNTDQDRSYLKASMGYRCLLEYRIYLLSEEAVFYGLYAGPLVMYKQRVEEVSEGIKDSKGYYTYTYQNRTRFGSAMGLGAVVGYQIPMSSNRFVFDAYVQLGGIVGFGDRTEAPIIGRPIIDPYSASTFVGTGITVGYKF